MELIPDAIQLKNLKPCLKPDLLFVALLPLWQARSEGMVKRGVCYLSSLSSGHLPRVPGDDPGESRPFGTGPSVDGLD